ncbi:uncharacterized protein BX664DRAFT_328480 [Halteromyces radiatus]|uniref:uncharacterized protein n=1 Tax=Halteromyces radiatus TaxID=101107 RepID=UPI00221EF081|nr:uncharacterized protein BX664DRAFT_328480 [Halteromyces radiatus]KAI8092911.1 hypothetical protein BX664DRAFT_328480 [Halteromyces radiatus]
MSDLSISASRQLIERNGGMIQNNQHSADILLTSLKSIPRIKRHLQNHQIPVIDVRWLKDCVMQKHILPIDSYIIMNKRTSASPLSTEDNDYYIPQPTSILTKTYDKNDTDTLIYAESDTSDDDNEDTNEHYDIDPSYNNTKYACLRPTPLKALHNGKLVAYLHLLETSRELESNDKSALAYSNAVSAIKSYPRRIRSSTEAGKIKGVGSKIKEIVRVYLETSTVPEAEALLSDERFRTLKLFNKCFGVGPSTARAWWDMGYRSLQQVLDQASLTSTVRLGIQLLPDFIIPMTRDDVEELIDIIETQVMLVDDQLLIIPVGGYRRGKEKNGDLDIIISSKQEKNMDGILDSIIERLKSQGYAKHILWRNTYQQTTTFAKRYQMQQESRENEEDYQFITKSLRRTGFDDLPKVLTCFMQPSKKVVRQVDLIISTYEQFPTAVLGWTGSRQFERSIRDYAKMEKNIKLKSNQMYTRTIPERIIPVASEMDIFNVLDIPFVPPKFRNC